MAIGAKGVVWGKGFKGAHEVLIGGEWVNKYELVQITGVSIPSAELRIKQYIRGEIDCDQMLAPVDMRRTRSCSTTARKRVEGNAFWRALSDVVTAERERNLEAITWTPLDERYGLSRRARCL